MFCAKCGTENIEAVNFCKSCGNSFNAGGAAVPKETTGNETNNLMKIVLGLVGVAALGFIVLYVIPSMSGFSSEDIDNVKKSIRAEFEGRGLKVVEVAMIKESPKKLNGFAKVSVEGVDIQKTCTATYGEGAQYLWQCE